ncbi:MAG: T9SS type A sorting domain-containing protein [Saprospiraceae bacterium]
MKSIFALLPFFLFSLSSMAQMTGSFQQTISFNEADYNFTRTLYYFVPTDYDSNQSYKLVVGFRGGPHSNAGEFRTQLSFLADSINAIVVCPENEGHFWNEEGLTKQLFKYTVDTTQNLYNIDPDYIYLTGLSYGGRHAVIVSMDTEAGAIPNLRGVIPFAAGLQSEVQPDYAAITNFPPACICIGLSDNQDFQNVSNSLHNDISINGGTSMLNGISGVGHTVAFPSYPDEMMECFNFIESQYPTTSTAAEIKSAENLIKIFPNPARQQISFSFPKTIIPREIYITDISGKLILEVPLTASTIDISKLSSGIKNLVVVGKSKRVSQSFSVVR